MVAGEGGEVEAEPSGEDAGPPVATDATDEEDEGKDTGDFTVEDAEAQTGMPGVQSLRTLPTATGEARARADAVDEQDEVEVRGGGAPKERQLGRGVQRLQCRHKAQSQTSEHELESICTRRAHYIAFGNSRCFAYGLWRSRLLACSRF